jgi:hypothetical protein
MRRSVTIQPRRTTRNGLSVTSERVRGSLYKTSTRVAVVGKSTIRKLELSATLTTSRWDCDGRRKGVRITFTASYYIHYDYNKGKNVHRANEPSGRRNAGRPGDTAVRCLSLSLPVPDQPAPRRASSRGRGRRETKVKEFRSISAVLYACPDRRPPYSDLDVDSARPRWPGLRFCLRYSSGLRRGRCRNTH